MEGTGSQWYKAKPPPPSSSWHGGAWRMLCCSAAAVGSPRGKRVLVHCVIPEGCFSWKQKQVDWRWADSNDSWAEEQEWDLTSLEMGTARGIIRAEDKSLEVPERQGKIRLNLKKWCFSTTTLCCGTKSPGREHVQEHGVRMGSEGLVPAWYLAGARGWFCAVASLARRCCTFCRHPAGHLWRMFYTKLAKTSHRTKPSSWKHCRHWESLITIWLKEQTRLQKIPWEEEQTSASTKAPQVCGRPLAGIETVPLSLHANKKAGREQPCFLLQRTSHA